jgi:hypothetical protein
MARMMESALKEAVPKVSILWGRPATVQARMEEVWILQVATHCQF